MLCNELNLFLKSINLHYDRYYVIRYKNFSLGYFIGNKQCCLYKTFELVPNNSGFYFYPRGYITQSSSDKIKSHILFLINKISELEREISLKNKENKIKLLKENIYMDFI
jgi:hypothetical protein